MNEFDSKEEASIVGFDAKDQTSVLGVILTCVAALADLAFFEEMTEYAAAVIVASHES